MPLPENPIHTPISPPPPPTYRVNLRLIPTAP